MVKVGGRRICLFIVIVYKVDNIVDNINYSL